MPCQSTEFHLVKRAIDAGTRGDIGFRQFFAGETAFNSITSLVKGGIK